MKVLAISDRGSKKDFVDIYFLLKKYSLKEILDFFNKKYASYNYNTMHILKSLVYFVDAEEDADPIYLRPTDWEEVKNNLQSVVKTYLQN